MAQTHQHVFDRPIRYLDRGVERVVAAPHEHEHGTTVAVASASSPAVREYEDKLKAIEMQRRGIEKAAIATKLGRSERWVQRWWKQEPRLLDRPHGAQDAVFQRVPLAGFRDLEITRGFAQESSLFDILVRDVPWRRGKVMTRDKETGELVLRFDRQGRTIPASRLVADCPKGIDMLDTLLGRAFSKANIRDPQARVVLNLYTDGCQQLNSHRHDFWTCLISLGAPRVLLVDNRPHVMVHGDMIVFGTQMHGVPSMQEIHDGRISIVIFFYPDRDNLERRWQTVLGDGDDDEESPFDEVVSSMTINNDCRTGSVSTTTVPGATELAALSSALDPEAPRTRRFWRKTNAELQFMEYAAPPKVTVYSAGCGTSSKNELLAHFLRHGVSQLWDLRVGREGGLPIGREGLRQACRGRLQYRDWQIGTAAAGGLTKHLFHTEEGATMIYRLLCEAQHGKLCFLGTEADWLCDDLRMSVGVALAAFGACVIHLNFLANPNPINMIDSEFDTQPNGFQLPYRLKAATNHAWRPCSLDADLSTHVLNESVSAHVDDVPHESLQCPESSDSVSSRNASKPVGEALRSSGRRWEKQVHHSAASSPDCATAEDHARTVVNYFPTERHRGRWGATVRAPEEKYEPV